MLYGQGRSVIDVNAGQQRTTTAIVVAVDAAFKNGLGNGLKGGVAVALSAAIMPVNLRLVLAVAAIGPVTPF